MKSSDWPTRIKCGGFTLLECVLALLVLSCIILLFQPIVRLAGQYRDRSLETGFMMYQTGYIQLTAECAGYQLVSVDKTALTVKSEKDTYTIGLYKQMIRKGPPGHQPLMMDVRTVTFYRYQDAVKMDVRMLDGQTFTNYLYFKEE